jgi:catechol 2,3-dioxygenase-like lactoylglutathione lyase family enzyme
MAIILNHTIVPAHDKEASARFFARIFGLKYERSTGHFAPVRVNETLTLDFDDADSFDTHHYAFHVSDAEFDAIFKRVQEAGFAYGSEPWHLENRMLNDWNGGRGVYFRDPNGHILELMTRVPKA